MKFTGIRILLFLIIFLFLDLIFFHIYKYEIFDQPYSYGALSKLYSGTINTDIVIFGSSRTMLHLDPAVIEENTHHSAYNLGKDGTNIYQSFFTMEEYLLHNKKPKLIIFEADLNQLNRKNKLRFEKDKFRNYTFFSKHTLDLFNYSPVEKFSRMLVKSQFAANKLGVFYSFFTKTLLGKKEKEAKTKDFGEWLFSNGAQLKKGSLLHGDKLKETDPDFEISPEKLFQLEKVADFAGERQIAILFFSPPINYWMRNDGLDNGLSSIKKMVTKNQYVNHADYSYDQDFSLDTPLWWNGGHLNIDGARLLSKKISPEIMKMISRTEDSQR